MEEENIDFDSMLPFELNEYIFQKKIGSGSYSSAYLVKSIKYDTLYCAKVSPIDPSLIDKEGNICEPEVAALLNLDHPFIIQLFKFFVSYGHVFLILELCETTLEDILKIDGPLPKERVRNIASNLVSALCDCHKRFIAHRDIKPGNIFIDKYGRAKLADFGLSALLRRKELLDTVCGSRSFLAPEIRSGQPFCPFKADVWALGVTLYQMATGGGLPFQQQQTSGEVNYNDIVFPSYVDGKLVALMRSMMNVDCNARPSMKQIAMNPFFMLSPVKSLPPPLLPRKVSGSTSQRGSKQMPFCLSQASLNEMKLNSGILSSSTNLFQTPLKHKLFRPVSTVKQRHSLYTVKSSYELAEFKLNELDPLYKE